MVAILAHIRIKPERLKEFERIERELAADTHRLEPDCLIYECFRGAEPNSYYVLLAFRNEEAFFFHQVSEWHEKHAPALYECFADVRLEYIDPAAGRGLPLTDRQADYEPQSDVARKYRAEFPLEVAEWWKPLRAAVRE